MKKVNMFLCSFLSLFIYTSVKADVVSGPNFLPSYDEDNEISSLYGFIGIALIISLTALVIIILINKKRKKNN